MRFRDARSMTFTSHAVRIRKQQTFCVVDRNKKRNRYFVIVILASFQTARISHSVYRRAQQRFVMILCYNYWYTMACVPINVWKHATGLRLHFSKIYADVMPRRMNFTQSSSKINVFATNEYKNRREPNKSTQTNRLGDSVVLIWNVIARIVVLVGVCFIWNLYASDFNTSLSSLSLQVEIAYICVGQIEREVVVFCCRLLRATIVKQSHIYANGRYCFCCSFCELILSQRWLFHEF